jgi:hypothetical protein
LVFVVICRYLWRQTSVRLVYQSLNKNCVVLAERIERHLLVVEQSTLTSSHHPHNLLLLVPQSVLFDENLLRKMSKQSSLETVIYINSFSNISLELREHLVSLLFCSSVTLKDPFRSLKILHCLC